MEKTPGIKLSTVERVVKDVPPPISTPLEHDFLFKKDINQVRLVDLFVTKKGDKEMINIAGLQAHLLGEGKLHKVRTFSYCSARAKACRQMYFTL